GRTGSRIEVPTLIELAQHSAIIGVKDATGDLAALEQVLAGTDRETVAVLSGEDHLVADVIERGGIGVISASANQWPRESQTLCELALAGRRSEAHALQHAMQTCVEAVFSVKDPIPLAAMHHTQVRLPW